jgi:outer membrane lipoprotein-sorting protein
VTRPASAAMILGTAAFIVALAVVLALAVQAASQNSTEYLLGGVSVEEVARHAVLAPQIVDYEGTKVLSVLRGELMETVTINEAHRRPSKTRLDFLSPEGVAGRLVIDDGIQTWHYEPRLNIAFQGPSLAAPADLAVTWPPGRYRVRLLGVEEVIGRPTAVLSLWPRDGRRERRLWIDRTTGVALRSEERDADEGLVSTAYFTRISFGLNVPDALFRPRLPAGARLIAQGGAPGPLLPLPVLERMIGFALPVPHALPGGFTLVGGEPVRAGPLLAAHLHYTDGARTVALFIAPAARLGPPGRGAPVAQLGSGARTVVMGSMRLLLWEGKGTRLTLVGPLPLVDLVRLATVITPGH